MKYKTLWEIEQIAINQNQEKLISKQEFQLLDKFIFSSEMISQFMIGDIDNEIFLIVLTSKRIILIKKKILLKEQIKQFGLEQLEDIKLISDDLPKLELFFPKISLKISYVQQQELIAFGRLALENTTKYQKEIAQRFDIIN